MRSWQDLGPEKQSKGHNRQMETRGRPEAAGRPAHRPGMGGGGGSDLGARDEPRGSVSRRLKLVCEGAWGGGVGGRRKQMLAIFLYFAWF